MKLNKIAKKAEDMIKARIKELGLVKTGRLLNSISVMVTDDGFNVIAEDYFTPLDEEYNISDYVFRSNEFAEYAEKIMVEEIEDELNNLQQ